MLEQAEKVIIPDAPEDPTVGDKSDEVKEFKLYEFFGLDKNKDTDAVPKMEKIKDYFSGFSIGDTLSALGEIDFKLGRPVLSRLDKIYVYLMVDRGTREAADKFVTLENKKRQMEYEGRNSL